MTHAKVASGVRQRSDRFNPAPALRWRVAMIRLTNLTFGYSKRDPLFSGAQLVLPEPGFYAVFGASGSGKSTLGKIVAGLLQSSGDGDQRIPQDALFASCDDLLPQWMPVGRHLQAFTPSDAHPLLEDILKVSGLARELHDHLPTQLSHGQRQRFNLARYAVQSPACLVLDEPLVGVDQPARWRILEWLKAHRRGQTTVLISHELDDVALFAKLIVKLSSARPAQLTVIDGLDGDDASQPFDGVAHRRIRHALLKP